MACFDYPIVPESFASPHAGQLSTATCRAPSMSAFINGSVGLPGPTLYQLDYELLTACPNGRRYEGPGGTICAVP